MAGLWAGAWLITDLECVANILHMQAEKEEQAAAASAHVEETPYTGTEWGGEQKAAEPDWTGGTTTDVRTGHSGWHLIHSKVVNFETKTNGLNSEEND